MKRLPWVGGPSPAKKAPSVGSVYFCVPHENTSAPGSNDKASREAARGCAPQGRLNSCPLCFLSYIPSFRFTIAAALCFSLFLTVLSPSCTFFFSKCCLTGRKDTILFNISIFLCPQENSTFSHLCAWLLYICKRREIFFMQKKP